MRKNAIKAKMLRGESTTNGWCAFGSSYSAELLGHAGFDSVTVDLQHGMFDFAQAVPMLQALSATPACGVRPTSTNAHRNRAKTVVPARMVSVRSLAPV